MNNLNCQTSSNYNTINQSSAKDILYELKQYESFANNSNHHQVDQFNVNGYTTNRQANSSTGTNYSQNILNYNNSFYKINNINNYNYIKNQSTSPSSQFQRQNCYSKQRDKYLLKDKMEREEAAVECSQLVVNNNSASDVNGRNPAIHKFTSNSHTTTIPPTQQTIDDDEEQNTANPAIHRSQHFTQVSRTNVISLRNFHVKMHKTCVMIIKFPTQSFNDERIPSVVQSDNGGRKTFVWKKLLVKLIHDNNKHVENYWKLLSEQCNFYPVSVWIPFGFANTSGNFLLHKNFH